MPLLGDWSCKIEWGWRWIIESRRDSGGEIIVGEWMGPSSGGGEFCVERGGVTRREPPRRTWQVGQILTKRDMSSLGTLGIEFSKMLTDGTNLD
jgi:hypothetical protein